MKTHLISFIFILLLTVSFVQAQEAVQLVGSGKTGTITPGQTVAGEILVSEDGKQLQPINFVGHNGGNRFQGDFDAWYFDAVAGENYVISVKATGGDLKPTLLLIGEARIPTVSALDANADNDTNAGVCLRTAAERRYAILVHRTYNSAQTGQYELLLKTATEDELTGGSPTAVCPVGTFVTTLPDTVVNIRNGDGVRFAAIGRMQPNQLYVMLGVGSVREWRHILFIDFMGELRDGYVSERYTLITSAQPGDSP